LHELLQVPLLHNSLLIFLLLLLLLLLLLQGQHEVLDSDAVLLHVQVGRVTRQCGVDRH
jgi:hypothetical protein